MRLKRKNPLVPVKTEIMPELEKVEEPVAVSAK